MTLVIFSLFSVTLSAIALGLAIWAKCGASRALKKAMIAAALADVAYDRIMEGAINDKPHGTA